MFPIGSSSAAGSSALNILRIVEGFAFEAFFLWYSSTHSSITARRPRCAVGGDTDVGSASTTPALAPCVVCEMPADVPPADTVAAAAVPPPPADAAAAVAAAGPAAAAAAAAAVAAADACPDAVSPDHSREKPSYSSPATPFPCPRLRSCTVKSALFT